MMKMIFALVAIVVIMAGTYLLKDDSDFRRESRVFPAIPVTGLFSQDVSGLPEAKPTETVTFEEGMVYDLEIYPVKKKIGETWVRMLSYGGSVPGPVFRVKEGANATIRIKNFGDLETTLHSHGLRLENAFDGVPGMTQEPIRVGDTFEYRLKFPDPGIYWYHPHVRTDYALESGLAGNYLVIPKDAAYWSPADREEVLMIDDIALSSGNRDPFRREESDHALMGRYGNVMLVNGETDYRLEVRRGDTVRFFLTNAANVRPFNVAIPGAKLKLVGADLGRYERETFVESILLGPGERRVVEAHFPDVGTYALEHRTPDTAYALGQVVVGSEVNVSGGDFSSLRTNGSVLEEMAMVGGFFDRIPGRKLKLSVDMAGGMMGGGHGSHMMPDGTMMANGPMGMPSAGDGIEWEDSMTMMNRMSDGDMVGWKMIDQATGKENMDIDDWKFRVGDRVKIRIWNDPSSMHPMQHPIHFHGQRFVVLATDGERNDNRVWQDTALIPAGETWDILVEMTNPGEWMAHCHIAEHVEVGMMMPFSVRE